MGKGREISNLFSNGYGANIKNVIWGYNIGKGFTSPYNRFSLRYMNELTRESILDAINKLYDFTSNGGSGGEIMISKTQLSKLTDEEKSIITNKGWTISQVSQEVCMNIMTKKWIINKFTTLTNVKTVAELGEQD